MKATTASFPERLRRFVRWFFTVSPDAVIDPLPSPKSKGAAKGPRQDARLRAQHAGRLNLSDRKRS